jgi:tetratricopeptide (TPR) repeat protein
MADTALREGRREEFEALLFRTLEIAPDFGAARFRFATMRFADRDVRGILPHIDVLLKFEPENALFRSLKALALFWSREFDAAIVEFESFIGQCTDRPGAWLAYGGALRAARNANAVFAFRKAIEIVPTYSEAHVALVNAKSGDARVEVIRASLAQPGLPAEDRIRMHFALGKALECSELFPESFANYRRSNMILEARGDSDGANNKFYTRHAKAFFTPDFFRARAGFGCPEPDPIFIVGMPRSGTTLVEQILSSHSLVEALGEVTALPETGRRLAPDRPGDPRGGYPYVLGNLDADRWHQIGQQYLQSTRARRVFGTPFFTDKLPGNFAHVGLIQLALPNARIIDVRRHPLDCCFSCYKHYFPAELSPAQNLAEMGRFYADYVELMAHFDEVLPGKVYRVLYEELVHDFEAQVRRLLDHLALPFEDRCLRFHENSRLVLTLSADQVSNALYESGVGKWCHYEQWLEPLKRALGPVLDAYPGAPKFSPEDPAHGQAVPDPATATQRSGFVGLRRIKFETSSAIRVLARPEQ